MKWIQLKVGSASDLERQIVDEGADDDECGVCEVQMMIATNLDGFNDENGRRGLTKLMELSKDSEFGGGSFKLGPKKLGWLRRARGTVEKEVAATTI